MLGLFGTDNTTKWQEWRDALSKLSEDIQALPESEQKDTLKTHADALYNSMITALPRINTPDFDKAHSDAMSWIFTQHNRIHHGVVQPEFGGEFTPMESFQ